MSNATNNNSPKNPTFDTHSTPSENPLIPHKKRVHIINPNPSQKEITKPTHEDRFGFHGEFKSSGTNLGAWPDWLKDDLDNIKKNLKKVDPPTKSSSTGPIQKKLSQTR